MDMQERREVTGPQKKGSAQVLRKPVKPKTIKSGCGNRKRALVGGGRGGAGGRNESYCGGGSIIFI